MNNDFLLELLSEEIPARMQAKARNDLARMFAEELAKAGLSHEGIMTWSTPRRLALVARAVPGETEAVREELKGPRSSAPPQALDGFLRKTGLSRDQLEERDGVFYAVIDKPGRPAADVLGEAVASIIRDFPWPKSMRWGTASASMSALRWVRPLHSIVAILGEEIVPVAVEGVTCGATTLGHRFHHPGPITIGGAYDYAEKLRACHVIVDHEERERLVREGAREAAQAAGLALVEDDGLVVENAGLTEWPVPLLGRFDPDYLDVPREVIVLTMRTNQKYFACTGEDGGLAPAFVCTANIAANDGGAAIVEGNRRVLAARLSDARFFWEQDLKVPLAEQAAKLSGIVFHEKLGTVADKVERVAKLARWLVEEGIIPLPWGEGDSPQASGVRATGHPHPSAAGASPSAGRSRSQRDLELPGAVRPVDLSPGERERWADLAERAARLAKADLVTGMVGEFPELQGVIGGYLAAAQGEPREVSDAICDHYKPVGQGDEVPTAPVTVAVSLADKLDTLVGFFGGQMPPSGSKDPLALRRAALGVIGLITDNALRLSLTKLYVMALQDHVARFVHMEMSKQATSDVQALTRARASTFAVTSPEYSAEFLGRESIREFVDGFANAVGPFLSFFADRLKVQQREAGVRHDLIDAVFALGGEDDLVRLLARVRALQAFVETGEGRDLLAGYKRAANIIRKEAPLPSLREREGPALTAREGEGLPGPQGEQKEAGPHPNPLPQAGEGVPWEETALEEALDKAEPVVAAAIDTEDFTAAMAALASLRAPIDAFFEKVIVNDPDPTTRTRRLTLLARFRDAVHRVADFSKIEG